MQKYFDKHGTEIIAGMTIRISEDAPTVVHSTMDAEGNCDLGICATNMEYARAHDLSEWDYEYYLLSNFSQSDIEIISK